MLSSVAPASAPSVRRAEAPAATDPLEAALIVARRQCAQWRARSIDAVNGDRWLLDIPDVGPTCEVLIADGLFHDLRAEERDAMLAYVRATQDLSGAWLDADGNADLTLTTAGYWALAQHGEDRDAQHMARARRSVHSLGGAQRCHLNVRVWLALAGTVPWNWLPAVPTELWLLPDALPLAPAHLSPWARDMLTAYLPIARLGARIHLADVSELLLVRKDGRSIPPRLTRDGLAGDLLQTFDRMVKLGRKVPRLGLDRRALDRVHCAVAEAQQPHGGWLSVRPTLLSLVALRVSGAHTDDPRIAKGLAYLRRARGKVRIRSGEHAGNIAVAQGLTGVGLASAARLLRCELDDSAIAWLLDDELVSRGPWQRRADAPPGGWPIESGSSHHLDIEATAATVYALRAVPESSERAPAAWAARRRATEVLLAMQERDGSFARFERGESNPWLRRLPWRDADLLAHAPKDFESRLRITATALAQLGHMGFGTDDDRILRGLRWLEREASAAIPSLGLDTLAELSDALTTISPRNRHPLHDAVEQQVRSRQREDGSFGSVVDTARALEALVADGKPCVQADRAAKRLIEQLLGDTPLEHDRSVGLGLSQSVADPSAAAREACIALERYARHGGVAS